MFVNLLALVTLFHLLTRNTQHFHFIQTTWAPRKGPAGSTIAKKYHYIIKTYLDSYRSVFDFSYLLRLVLSFLLFCLFVWQTAYSFNKYLDGATGTAFRRENRGQMEFPSVSLCSYDRILGSVAAIMGGATKMNVSFAEDMEKRWTFFNKEFDL